MADVELRNLRGQVLADDWARLTKYTFDYRRRDGVWEEQVRQAYDRGDGAVLLPYDPSRGTVLLVRQFRLPAWLRLHGLEGLALIINEEIPGHARFGGVLLLRRWGTIRGPHGKLNHSILLSIIHTIT